MIHMYVDICVCVCDTVCPVKTCGDYMRRVAPYFSEQAWLWTDIYVIPSLPPCSGRPSNIYT